MYNWAKSGYNNYLKPAAQKTGNFVNKHLLQPTVKKVNQVKSFLGNGWNKVGSFVKGVIGR